MAAGGYSSVVSKSLYSLIVVCVINMGIDLETEVGFAIMCHCRLFWQLPTGKSAEVSKGI